MPACLIVDDSPVVRKIARRIVEDFGFSCVEAEDGKQAYDSCLQSMPDCILLDWNMPVMNGMEFMQKLKKMPGGDPPRIIFCSVENNEGRIRKALAAGADEYIMKPFDADIMKSKFMLIGAL